MPKPSEGESEKDFVSRCIPIVIAEGTAQDGSQAAAICHSLFLRHGKDAVVGNFGKVTKILDATLENEKKKYALIVQKYIDEVFQQSIYDLEHELSMKPNSLYDFNKTSAVREVLKTNATIINSELFDAINKEITLFLTTLELNNVPFTTAGLKAEVRKIFEDKAARLASQVITETTRAANVALEWGYKQSGVVTHKQWVSVLDDRTTVICQGLNGEVREIGQPFSTGDYGPPAHIWCRSRTIPITVSEQQ